MRSIEEVVDDLTGADDTPPELMNELFWCAMARGLASGTGAWGRLFADVRGWTKSGGDNAEKEQDRITDAEAAALVRAVLGADE
jgi:hypothetical protein